MMGIELTLVYHMTENFNEVNRCVATMSSDMNDRLDAVYELLRQQSE